MSEIDAVRAAYIAKLRKLADSFDDEVEAVGEGRSDTYEEGMSDAYEVVANRLRAEADAEERAGGAS